MKNHLIKCEHVMNKNGLCKIIFIIEEKTAPFCARELDEAAAALSEEGLEVLVIRADGHEKAAAREIPPNASALYLADSAALFQMLRSSGLPAAGYLHAGRNGESFQGAAYLVERPQDIDRDSYQKIYERAAGLPWTIAETARCLIREMTVDDVESLYLLYEDEQARRFLKPLCPDHDKEREIVKAYIDKVYGLFGYGMWVVIRKSDGALIGRVGFETGRKKEAPLGYLFRKDCRRQGYAFEVCDAVMRFAREELGFTGEDAAPLLTAYVEEENTASRGLLSRLGFMQAAGASCAASQIDADNQCAIPQTAADDQCAAPRADERALCALSQTAAGDQFATPRTDVRTLCALPQADEGALSVAPEAACGKTSSAPEAACVKASSAPAVPAGILRYVYRPADRGVQ